FARGRIHAQDRADRRAAHDPRLRSSRVRERPIGPASAGHAGNGSFAPSVMAEEVSVSDSPASRPVLWARDLGKRFRRETGDAVQALAGVSVEVRHGTL